MEMLAERPIAAPRPLVWQCLNDPEVLKACIPGCESIEATGPDSYKVAMVAAVGFIKARFVGDLALQNKVADTSYDLGFNGSGGAAGFGKGSASVALADGADGGTMLSYRVQAQVGGKLAQVGARVIDAVAKKMADEFFQRLDAHITRVAAPPSADVEQAPQPAATPAAAAAPAPAAPAPAASAPAAASKPNRAWLYAAAAVAVAVVAFIVLGSGSGS
ncbi:Carbon monoxide dehydrogenase subunit G (CoxG) [Pigmentiphaga humi]|uniref:Carbon monoxide dehydrogenase subunit G (CoxG) n=1 Tax=Pigmentiphaga humi TaxID=2478468 RepID=A0A3P4B4E9_9BURK|nr:carbon monoxide dehydrogenase subunit G [Pigmentiphaga humi]VCU70932.1 Carbon monoxide dehydrogenase subunit G (CoxG) [Pigmentiphaga humi]